MGPSLGAFGPPVVHAGRPPALRPVGTPEEFLTVPEVARRLRVSRSTIYALCSKGRLPHARVSNAIRISWNAVEALVGLQRART